MTELIDLSVETESLLDPTMNCGPLGFRLSQASTDLGLSFVSLSPEGSLTVDAFTLDDQALIGTYELTFDVYLLDLDPEVVKSQPLDLIVSFELTQPIIEEVAIEIDETIA